MKILQVVPYFYPAWFFGGPGKLVYDTSEYFAHHANQVTVYTSDAYDNQQRMPSSQRLKYEPNFVVHYFRNLSNSLAAFQNIFFTPGLIWQAIKEVSQFDIIHLHDFYTIQNVVIVTLARLYHRPYVLSVHGCLEEKRMDRHSLFKKTYLFCFGHAILKNASAVIATSANEVGAYQKHGVVKEKIFRLGHGITLDEFLTTLPKKTALKQLKLPTEKIIVTYLGRLHAIKGLDVLVHAVALMKKKNIHVVIAGSDDGYLDTLNDLIEKLHVEEHVTVMGACFGEQKKILFRASDIFVYPSYSEGFSLGILEAAAAGLPLIISTGCHFPEAKKWGAGLVVEPKPKAFSQAIEAFATSADVRKLAGQSAQKLIQQKYSMDAIGSQLIAIYAQVKKNDHLT